MNENYLLQQENKKNLKIDLSILENFFKKSIIFSFMHEDKVENIIFSHYFKIKNKEEQQKFLKNLLASCETYKIYNKVLNSFSMSNLSIKQQKMPMRMCLKDIIQGTNLDFKLDILEIIFNDNLLLSQLFPNKLGENRKKIIIDCFCDIKNKASKEESNKLHQMINHYVYDINIQENNSTLNSITSNLNTVHEFISFFICETYNTCNKVANTIGKPIYEQTKKNLSNLHLIPFNEDENENENEDETNIPLDLDLNANGQML